MSEIRYRASITIFISSAYAYMITGFINVLPFACWSFFTGEFCPIVLECPKVLRGS